MGYGYGAGIDHVPPAELNPSPYHDRTFDAAGTADFIVDVRREGTVGLLTARETPAGIELVDGHKRALVARQAGLDTVAVRVLNLDDEAAAEAFARNHDHDLDDLRPLVEERSPDGYELRERLAVPAVAGPPAGCRLHGVLPYRSCGHHYPWI